MFPIKFLIALIASGRYHDPSVRKRSPEVGLNFPGILFEQKRGIDFMNSFSRDRLRELPVVDFGPGLRTKDRLAEIERRSLRNDVMQNGGEELSISATSGISTE